jgi:hypothetical protein
VKSPGDLAARWAKQWQNADTREARLLNSEAWPVSLAIGKPTPHQLTRETLEVRAHLQRWRSVAVGEVLFETMTFRGGTEPVEVPVAWRLHSAQDWVTATDDPLIQREFQRAQKLLRTLDPIFHRTIVRQRNILALDSEETVIRAAQVALHLSPGYANGRPLRSLAVLGTDSKFFERHRALLIQLLDARFDGEVSESGLETFLGAPDEGNHWLLVAPLCSDLLPFAQQRVRAAELRSVALPGSHLLIVENEQCLHQLPSLPNTVAVLGAGLHLEWMDAAWIGQKHVAYWGDIDTWGLTLLAKARAQQPHLAALMMSRELFETHRSMAVAERNPAPELAPEGLTPLERGFYGYLRGLERGRLEQEFIPRELVGEVLRGWWGGVF